MSTNLLSQLESYGDVFAAAVDAQHEEQTMRTDDKLVSVQPEQTSTRTMTWKPIVGALGAVAVFVAAIVGINVARQGDTVASAPFNSGEEAAIAFTSAWNTGDWDAVRATMSDDGTLVDGPVDGDGEDDHGRRLGIAFDDARGVESTVVSCDATGVGGGYDCVVTFKSEITEALGMPTLTTNRTFGLNDSGYLDFVSDFEFPDPKPIFLEWVAFSADLQAEADAVWSDDSDYTEDDIRDIGRRMVASAKEFMATR